MSWRSAWVVFFGMLAASAAEAADFLGAESCKGCHPEAYQAWSVSKHARATEVLSPLQQKDVRCLSCHSPNQAEQSVTQVSCETCHGGGQYYSPSYVMKDAELARLVGLVDPNEKSCRTCHDDSSPSLQPFVFADKLKLIDHWSAERARRAREVKGGAKSAEAPAPVAAPARDGVKKSAP